MEKQPEWEKQASLSPEIGQNQLESNTPTGEPRYGVIASQDTRWVYGDKEYQGGDPRAYVAQQRRLEAEKRAREAAEAEKVAAERAKATNSSSKGFFADVDSAVESKPRRWRAENPFHDVSTSPLSNSNFGAADMSGQAGGMRAGFQPDRVNLPSRKAPITMFVIGLLLMFIIAPVVFFGGIMTVVDAAHMEQVADKSELQVQVEKDTFTVVTAKQADLRQTLKCEATQAGQKLVDWAEAQEQESQHEKTFVYQSTESGLLKIKCSSQDGKAPLELTVTAGLPLIEIMILFGVSTVLGLLGLILTIWGIIWWVRRNRLRRMALMGL